MNSGCGKIHTHYMGKTGFNPMSAFKDLPLKRQKEIANNLSKYMVVSVDPVTKKRTPAISKMDGSLKGDYDYHHRDDAKINRKWWEFWK
jgi:hypothetical protein